MENKRLNEIAKLEEAKNKINELKKLEERRSKLLLNSENVLLLTSTATLISSIVGASYGDFSDLIKTAFIISGTTVFIAGCTMGLKIEQEAGYYKCSKCGHSEIPKKYSKVFFAPHIGRTRYMKCNECGEKSWQKKVLVKDNNTK